MLAGLWGVKRGVFGNGITSILNPYLVPSGFGKDQDFLSKEVFPFIKEDILVHTSQDYRYSKEETIIKFPLEWTDAMYCGKIVTN
jgi:hypothetical protein